MEEIFKIGEHGSHALVQRQMKNTLKWIVFAELVICIFFIYAGGIDGLGGAVLFFIVITGAVLLGFFKKNASFKTLRYAITTDRFIQFIDAENSDTLVQIVRARNESRYGIKDQKEVLFNDIDKVFFKKSGEVHVYSIKYDSLTHNGRIIFYPEMEKFDQVKNFIKERFPNNISE